MLRTLAPSGRLSLLTFEFSVDNSKPPRYVCEGRAFTLRQLKEALLRSCSGYINSAYFQAWELPLWELVELIEIVAEINKPPEDSVDFYEAATAIAEGQ